MSHGVKDHFADPILDDMLCREVIIDNRSNSNEHENYQVSLEIDTNHLFFAAQDALRFVDENLKIIDHWNESFPGAQWLEVPKIPASAMCALHMLDGNPSASSASNGTNTFIQYHGVASANYLDSLSVYPDDIIYETIARSNVGNTNIWYGLGEVLADNPSDGMVSKINKLGSTYPLTYFFSFNDNSSTAESQPDIFEGAYVRIRLEIHDAELHGFYNDAELFSAITTNLPNENLGLGSYRASGGGDQKWAFARKYASPEPTAEIGAMI